MDEQPDADPRPALHPNPRNPRIRRREEDGEEERLPPNAWRAHDFDRFIEEFGPLRPFVNGQNVNEETSYSSRVNDALQVWLREGRDPFGERRPFFPVQMAMILESLLRSFEVNSQGESPDPVEIRWGRVLTRCGLMHGFVEDGLCDERFFQVVVCCNGQSAVLPIFGKRCLGFFKAMQNLFIELVYAMPSKFKSKSDEDVCSRLMQIARNVMHETMGALLTMCGQKNINALFEVEITDPIDGLREHVKQIATKTGVFYSLESYLMVRPVQIQLENNMVIHTRYYMAATDPAKFEPLTLQAWISRILMNEHMLDVKPFLKRYINEARQGGGARWRGEGWPLPSSDPPSSHRPLRTDQEDREHRTGVLIDSRCPDAPDQVRVHQWVPRRRHRHLLRPRRPRRRHAIRLCVLDGVRALPRAVRAQV